MQKIAKNKQPKKANKPAAFLDPNSPMLAPGTPNDGTVDEYAITVQNIIKVHATADMPMKIPGKGRMIVSVVDWPALRHVLNVLFGPGEKTEETLTYKPPAIEQRPKSTLIMP